MSVIDSLLANYSRQISLPWPANMAGKQRIWFAVYPPSQERRIRARLTQFETHTLEAGHSWFVIDLTRLLPEWISKHEYCEGIFESPEHFSANSELEDLCVTRVRQACSHEDANNANVTSIIGLASLFDYIRVSSLMDRIEDSIRGRLLVFFPGEYAGNVYRFMDARDGFNYMAVPITCTESFIST